MDEAKKKNGRPKKSDIPQNAEQLSLRKKQLEKLLDYMRLGLSITDACEIAGVPRTSYYALCEKDPVFKHEAETAQLNSKMRAIAKVQKAAENTWQAAAWWLERKYKNEFAKREEQTGAEGKELNKMTFKIVNEGGSDGVIMSTDMFNKPVAVADGSQEPDTVED